MPGSPALEASTADRRAWMPGVAVVALAVMVAILLIARPTQELPLTTLAGPAGPPPPSALVREPAWEAARPVVALAAPTPSPGQREPRPAASRPLPRPPLVERGRPVREPAQAP